MYTSFVISTNFSGDVDPSTISFRNQGFCLSLRLRNSDRHSAVSNDLGHAFGGMPSAHQPTKLTPVESETHFDGIHSRLTHSPSPKPAVRSLVLVPSEFSFPP